ncbi:MAG TPA: metallophosphoesterase family protein [Bacillota bacterium]|jgi:putative phosphoesterase
MTKVAVLSDIHGNLQALRAVLDDVHRQGPDFVVCAGDLVVYGPFPNECVALVRACKIVTVMGNRDWAVAVRQPGEGYAVPVGRRREVEVGLYGWTDRTISEENRAFLAGLPRRLRLRVGQTELLVVHGTCRSPFEYLRVDDDESLFTELAEVSRADVIVAGHTHVPFWRRVGEAGGPLGEVLFANAGSVGWPKDRRPEAAYLELTVNGREVRAETRRIAYPVEETVAAMRQAGLPETLMEALTLGTEIR